MSEVAQQVVMFVIGIVLTGFGAFIMSLGLKILIDYFC